MKGFIKTLFGDKHTLIVVGLAMAAAALLLHSPAWRFTGVVLPPCLLAGAAYLARR